MTKITCQPGSGCNTESFAVEVHYNNHQRKETKDCCEYSERLSSASTVHPSRYEPSERKADNTTSDSRHRERVSAHIVMCVNYLEATDVGLNASSYLQSMWIYNQIPDNQWAIEIVEWERYIWAQLQTFVSDYSVGYGIQWPELTPLLRRNMTNGEKRLCQVQRRMKSGCSRC